MSQVVAITAPASDVGRAQARAYAAAGWDVALIGRGWAGLEAAAADVRAAGREALVLPIDLTDRAARALAVERVRRELGPIEAWVADGAVPRIGRSSHPSPPRARRRHLAGMLTATGPGVARIGLVGAGVLTALAIRRLARRS
jgi:NAD(P)-dependent dehydrogenase (short-subunit alcohol dehydrogenase family)